MARVIARVASRSGNATRAGGWAMARLGCEGEERFPLILSYFQEVGGDDCCRRELLCGSAALAGRRGRTALQRHEGTRRASLENAGVPHPPKRGRENLARTAVCPSLNATVAARSSSCAVRAMRVAVFERSWASSEVTSVTSQFVHSPTRHAPLFHRHASSLSHAQCPRRGILCSQPESERSETVCVNRETR